MFETFDHTADLGIRVVAPDRGALFAEAGRALFTVIAGSLDGVRTVESRHVTIATTRLDDLFFDWLNELLYLFENERMLLSEFHVHVDDGTVRAEVHGEPWDSIRCPLEHEVKAITYHGLRVERIADGWIAEVIVDI